MPNGVTRDLQQIGRAAILDLQVELVKQPRWFPGCSGTLTLVQAVDAWSGERNRFVTFHMVASESGDGALLALHRQGGAHLKEFG